MLLSIIVPVFNVEPYLQKSVDSLLEQDLPEDDYEIILVNDGSQDRCPEICEGYAKEYRCIRVIHQENRGLSAARNTGIAAAKGRFIQFVDSDDYLESNVLGRIIKQLEESNLDILRINYQNVNESGEVFEPNKYSKPFVDYSEEICDGLTFLNERLGFACYAVQFIIRTELLLKDGNGFKEGIYFEDAEWAPRILLQAKRIASSPIIVYNYLFRQGSITRNEDSARQRKTIEDKLSLVSTLQKLGEGTSDRRWFNAMVAQITLTVLQSVSQHFYQNRRQYIHRLKGFKVFPLSDWHSTKSTAKKIWLVNLSPELYCILYHIKNG